TSKKSAETSNESVIERKKIEGKTGSKKPIKGSVIDDVVIQAFEQLHEIYNYKDHDVVAAAALKVMTSIINSRAGAVFLKVVDKEEFYISKSEGIPVPASKDKQVFSMLKGILGNVVKGGLVLNITDIGNSSSIIDENDFMPKLENIKSLICIPMAFEGRTIGVFELFRADGDDEFTESEIHAASYIAGSVAEYMERSLPYRSA
ncbi:MAG: GAF domain-containing protein, partial [Deltaproteobacteria bacterium]|nr:GAF domain-containing protein [Deltaproteobacteria bacterium]